VIGTGTTSTTSSSTTTSLIPITMSSIGSPNDTADDSVRVLGVCGGIGSGKSTACKLLVSSCNCLVHIDADSVAHSVYAPGSQAVRDVVANFGRSEIAVGGDDGDGDDDDRPLEIDRKKLGAIVFADRSKMAELEAIVWPHVRVALRKKIDRSKEEWKQNKNENGDDSASASRRPVVVLEAAVLLDAGWENMVDGVWAVTVPRKDALQRLIETRGLTSEEATKRIDAQKSCRGIGNLSEEVENGVVTGVVVNDGSLEDLKQTLEKSLDDPSFWKQR